MNANSEVAVLLLGSNLGDRIYCLNQAVNLINKNCGKIFRYSSFYESAPWGFHKQPRYINQCVLIETHLQPLELLNELKKIETLLGRKASGKWQARIIDIDILLFGNSIIEKANLVIPHPLLSERKFTLVPLQEVLPELMHPVLNKSISELLNGCNDSGEVIFFQPSEMLHA